MYDFFSDFFDDFDFFPTKQVYKDVKTCPICKSTYTQFQKTGKLGCSECYKTFREPMTITLKQIHSNAVHTGKVPSRCSGDLKRTRLYDSLKKQLAISVQNEDYETAAKLHKEIREMESEGK